MPSLRSFVSRLPAGLLHEWLAHLDVQLNPAEMPGPADLCASIERQLDELSPARRTALDGQVDRVCQMADEQGEVAMEAATTFTLRDLPGSHARALWMLLNEPDKFQHAEDIRYTDEHRYGRKWTASSIPPNLVLARDPSALDGLKDALRKQFGTPNVHVDIFKRSRQGFEKEHQLVQITIYREGPPSNEPAFIDGELGSQIRRPVIEAAVTFEASSGRLECVASTRDSREDVMSIVAEMLLGSSVRCVLGRDKIYDLSVLAQPQTFTCDPEDGIEDVRVAMLRLRPIETATARITVESQRGAESDIWTMIAQRLGPEALSNDYLITQAKLVIRYRPKDGGRVRSLPVTITHPDRSNLKEMIEMERIVAEKYLPRWGLRAE